MIVRSKRLEELWTNIQAAQIDGSKIGEAIDEIRALKVYPGEETLGWFCRVLPMRVEGSNVCCVWRETEE